MKPAHTVPRLIDQRPLSGLQWWVLGLCTLVVLLDGLDLQAAAFTGPAIAAQWQLERSSMGPIYAMGLAGGAIGALLMGPIGDRYGRRPALLLSVLAFGSATLLTAWVQNFEQLLVMRLLTGIGLGGAMPNTTALMSEYAPRRLRNLCVAVTLMGIPLGGIVGGLLASWLLPRYGWTSVYIAGGIAPLATLPLLWRRLPESLAFLADQDAALRTGKLASRIDPAASEPAAPTTATPGKRDFPVRLLFEPGYAGDTIKLWITFFTSLIALNFLMSWTPSLVMEAGFELRHTAWAAVALNLGGVTGPLLVAALTGRYGTHVLLPATLLLAAVSVAITGRVGDSLPLLLALTFCSGFFAFGAQIGLTALSAYVYPTHARATGVGWTIGIGRIGAVFGPLLGGLLLQMKLGLPNYFLAISSVLVIAALSTFLIRRHQPAAAGQLP